MLPEQNSAQNLQIQRILKAERLQAVQDYEKNLVEQNIIPDTRKLLMNRIKRPAQYLGALILGVLISLVTLLGNFYIFNTVIHI
jgi:hypothetical protein